MTTTEAVAAAERRLFAMARKVGRYDAAWPRLVAMARIVTDPLKPQLEREMAAGILAVTVLQAKGLVDMDETATCKECGSERPVNEPCGSDLCVADRKADEAADMGGGR